MILETGKMEMMAKRTIQITDSSSLVILAQNSSGAPKGMFKGTEQPSQRLGKILAIVKEGPKKHGNEAYAWASEALKTMQDKLKKD